MTNVQKMLQEILDNKVIDQKRLADKLNVSPAQITRWLNAVAQPRLENYEKLEELYKKLA